MSAFVPRRDFLKSTLAASAAAALPMQFARADQTKKPKLRIAVKYGMIKHAGSIEDKFNLIKKLGLAGVEVDSPSGLNKAEAKAAAAKTGIVIHGVIDSVHWRDTLSSSDADVRAKGLAALNGAIEDAAFFGCDTVLLVPGVVKDDVTFEQCYERSQAEIKRHCRWPRSTKSKSALRPSGTISSPSRST